MTTLKTAALAAGALAVLAIGGEAEARATRVTFQDLNVATAEGAAELHARIVSAARRVCRENGLSGVLISPRAREACIADTVNDAVARLGLPELSRHAAAQSRAEIGPVAALEAPAAQ